MILFPQDFAAQGAVVHYETINDSAIRMHELLKRMGIVNNQFFLALHDQSLRNVDPHNLTPAQNTPEVKMRIIRECRLNPWYYIREVVRVPMQGKDGSPYVFHRANLAQLWLFFCSVDTFQTIPRQCGKTIAAVTILSHIMFIAGFRCNIGMFAADPKLVRENISRLKLIRDNLPPFMVHSTPQDTDNVTEIKYDALKNAIITYTPTTDPLTAERTARGETFIFEWWDELPFYKYNSIAYSAAIPARATGRVQARENGIRCADIITTTAGNLRGESGRFAYQMRSNAMVFNESLYDSADEEELIKRVRDNSSNHVVYLEYSFRQLGRTDQWFRDITAAIADRNSLRRDYFNKWEVGGEQTVLPKELLKELERNVLEPTKVTWIESMQINWYVPPSDMRTAGFFERPFIIGMDLSDNVGRDFTTAVILDPTNMSVVGTFRCNLTNMTFVIRCIVLLLTEFPRSILIPERNRSGATFLDLIIEALREKGFNPFKRIFNSLVQNYSSLKNQPDLSREDPNLHKDAFGFKTTASETSRPLLYQQVLHESVKRNVTRIFDSCLIEEIGTLTIRNGRVDHAAGGHDDMVIAYLLACYLVLFGRELHLYGLRPDELLCRVSDQGNDAAQGEREEQSLLVLERNRLAKQLDCTKSEFLRRGIEMRLHDLDSRIRKDFAQQDIVAASQLLSPTPDPHRAQNHMDITKFQRLIAGLNPAVGYTR